MKSTMLKITLVSIACIALLSCKESEFSATQKAKAPSTGDQTGTPNNPNSENPTNNINTTSPEGGLTGQNGEEYPGTKVAMVGASFEDSTDKSDWTKKDVHVCVKGDFKVDGRSIVSTARGKQTVLVVTRTGGACQHEVYLKILGTDGAVRDSVTVSSRNQNVTTTKEWKYGEKLSFSMRPTVDGEPGQCTPLGEILHTNTDAQRIQWYTPGSCPPGL